MPRSWSGRSRESRWVSSLAIAYQAAGRTAEAIPLLEQTVADMERVLGADHPDTLQARGNLAAAYLAAGRTAEEVALSDQPSRDKNRGRESSDP